MINPDNISGARIISGSNMASGSIVVNNPFIMSVSGELDVYAKTNEGIKVYIPASDVVIAGSNAKVRWIEKKKSN